MTPSTSCLVKMGGKVRSKQPIYLIGSFTLSGAKSLIYHQCCPNLWLKWGKMLICFFLRWTVVVRGIKVIILNFNCVAEPLKMKVIYMQCKTGLFESFPKINTLKQQNATPGFRGNCKERSNVIVITRKPESDSKF